MYPFWYPQPYWYNYYYYFYKYPSVIRNEDEIDDMEYEEPEDINEEIDDQYRSSQETEVIMEEDVPVEGGYVPSPPTQYPIGSLGYYGSIGEMLPGVPTAAQQPGATTEEIMSILDRTQPEILRTMAQYRIPYNTAVDILRRIVETTLRYCR